MESCKACAREESSISSCIFNVKEPPFFFFCLGALRCGLRKGKTIHSRTRSKGVSLPKVQTELAYCPLHQRSRRDWQWRCERKPLWSSVRAISTAAPMFQARMGWERM